MPFKESTFTSNDDVDDSMIVEDVHFSSKINSIIEDISVGSETSILDEGHASYEGTRGLVGDS